MADYADCLARFLTAIGVPAAHVVGLSFGGALAIELHRQHPHIPTTLTLASAYAGWGGSLPPEVADNRLTQAMALAETPPDEFVAGLLPTMFRAGTAPDVVGAFGASMRRFHPDGFRSMARASREDLRDALPGINVPTLLLYGAEDIRAPLPVAEHLNAAIFLSRLVVLRNARHLCNIEAAEQFNQTIRDFLHATIE